MTDIYDGNGGTGVDILDGGAVGNPGPFDIFDGNGEADHPTTIPVEVGDPSAVSPSDETRYLHIESMDGTTVIPLSVDVDRILKAGATGLGLPPLDVVTSTTPGMPGSWLQEVNVLEREVFLPLQFSHDRYQAQMLANLAELRRTMWVDQINTGDLGTFLLVAESSAGERVLAVTYKSGWEGSWGGSDSGVNWENFGLTLVAVDPYWRDRTPTSNTYRATPGEVFIGTGDNTNPWPRQISPDVVIGTNMQIAVAGDVPVWPTLELDGPTTLVEVTYAGTDVLVPNGVPTSQNLLLVTDPRARSARLNGAIAWNLISMGSTFAPLMPGTNSVSVQVGTAGTGTGLVMSWTPGYLTPW